MLKLTTSYRVEIHLKIIVDISTLITAIISDTSGHHKPPCTSWCDSIEGVHFPMTTLERAHGNSVHAGKILQGDSGYTESDPHWGWFGSGTETSIPHVRERERMGMDSHGKRHGAKEVSISLMYTYIY